MKTPSSCLSLSSLIVYFPFLDSATMNLKWMQSLCPHRLRKDFSIGISPANLENIHGGTELLSVCSHTFKILLAQKFQWLHIKPLVLPTSRCYLMRNWLWKLDAIYLTHAGLVSSKGLTKQKASSAKSTPTLPTAGHKQTLKMPKMFSHEQVMS